MRKDSVIHLPSHLCGRLYPGSRITLSRQTERLMVCWYAKGESRDRARLHLVILKPMTGQTHTDFWRYCSEKFFSSTNSIVTKILFLVNN
jgi:hypothetical protein